jgi:formylglycine-generating enzyme required for sulfatase activity
MWDEVATWAAVNGYDINTAGASGKGTNHPAYYVTWYECVKWCNARSRKENLTPCYTVSGVEYKSGNSAPDCNWNANGYRLPTDAEWTKAARGGLVGKRFPWGDVISHSEANFNNDGGEAYQTGTIGYHPTYATGGTPHTSPAGSFAANGYGLYDMTGNVWEWCWDWAGTNASGEQTDPRGASSGSLRVGRGGCWYSLAYYCRVAYRYDRDPTYPDSDFGFRVARSAVP